MQQLSLDEWVTNYYIFYPVGSGEYYEVSNHSLGNLISFHGFNQDP